MAKNECLLIDFLHFATFSCAAIYTHVFIR